MADRPDVSVVIPTRDRWPELARAALPSALGQLDVDVEVLVVDDGSTDETAARLAERAAAETRLSVLRHERSRGVAAARNTGIAAARADWIAFLDDDDVWAPHKLATQLRAARPAGASAVYAGAVAVDECGHVLYTYYFPEPADIQDQLLRAAVVPAGASNVVVRAQLLRELGGFDESFFHLEDWDLWIRLAAAAAPAAVRDVLVAVRLHPTNKHATNDQAEELERLIRKHASLTPPRILTVDRLGHARWVAGQHSRAGSDGRAAGLYLRAALEHRSPGDLVRALDALLGKRLTSLARRRGRNEPPPAGAAPNWLSSSRSTIS